MMDEQRKKKAALAALVATAVVAATTVGIIQLVEPEVEQGPYQLYMPYIAAHPNVAKGVAGKPKPPATLEDVNGGWYHYWHPCDSNDSNECVEMVKYIGADWCSTENVIDALERCSGGYIGFGDEWILQGKSKEWQLTQTHEFLELAEEVNPGCRVILGGVLTYHPDIGSAGLTWIGGFRTWYIERYGEPPGVDGIMVDAYDWQPSEPGLVQQVSDARYAVTLAYGADAELWLRETGSLLSLAGAMAAVDKLEVAAPVLDRYAWFVSGPTPDWPFAALWDASGNLTPLGRKYRDMYSGGF